LNRSFHISRSDPVYMGNIEKAEIYDLYTKEYAYDVLSRKTALQAYEIDNPSNVYITQSWSYNDITGRLQSSTIDGSTIELDYYDNNALKQINYLDVNLKEVYNIGNRGEILDIRFKNSSNTDLSVIEYGYDNRLNRISQGINLPDGTTENISYEYDNLDRLTGVSYSNLSKTIEYSYDDLGNRETKTEDGATINYNYNKDNNHLQSISTGESYTYNDRGDMMSSDGTTFDYDEEGRLINVDMGDSTLGFLYSAEGKRIRKIAESNSNVDTIYYVYDGMNVVVELNGSLNKKTSYGYIGAMLVMVEDAADNKHYYSHDGLGSIIAIYDASGNYVNVYMYDEFGNFIQKTENISNSYYYTGQELDAISGLYNLRNRYYNASLGRFTQLDPIVDLLGLENMQELNGYTYVANNPMVLVDPFGLCGESVLPVWMSHFLEAYLEMKKEEIRKFFDTNEGYGDINITGGEVIVSTTGFIRKDGVWYFYIGFGVGLGSPLSVTITRSGDDVSFGWNVAVGASFAAAGQMGIHSYSMQSFSEAGVNLIPIPGVNAVAFYVFEKWPFPSKGGNE